MTIFTDTWNNAFQQSPADTDDASEGALRIRKTREATKERIAVDHAMAGDAHDGKHNKVSLRSQSADPTLDAGDGATYGKTIGGILEFFFKDSTGQVIQITSNGRFNLAALPSSISDAATLNGQAGSFYTNSSNQSTGTLPLERLPATLTGKDADTLDGQHGAYYRDVPSGSYMLFWAAAAPTGWVTSDALNDKLIRVVSSGGGGTGGSWTISGLSVAGHALTEAEMPPHTHPYQDISIANGGAVMASGSGKQDSAVGRTTSSTGGGNSHTHGISHDGSWRPSYVDFILGQRV